MKLNGFLALTIEADWLQQPGEFFTKHSLLLYIFPFLYVFDSTLKCTDVLNYLCQCRKEEKNNDEDDDDDDDEEEED